MRRFVAVVVLACAAGIAFGEEAATAQIGLRILSDHVRQESEKRSSLTQVIGWSLIGSGALVTTGSLSAWYLQDRWRPGLATPLTDDQVSVGCLATGSGGVALMVGGAVALIRPRDDTRKQYELVFSEKDPVVQEALAVSVLKGAADRGRDARITRAFIGLLVPVATFAVRSVVNAAQDKEWYAGYENVGAWQIPAVASNVISLFTQSDEERRYGRYLAARSAIYP